MIRVVLAFVDGSAQSEHALPWACELAARSAAELRLVRAHLTPVPDISPDGMMLPYPVTLDADVRAAEQANLDHTLARVRSARPDLSVSAALVDGDTELTFADALARYAAGCEAEFGVLTTHGHGPFARFWLGSVADEYVRHAAGPTLLLRPGSAAADLTARPEVRRVVVPLDGSGLAEQALTPALKLADRLDARELVLLRVIDPTSHAEALPALESARLPDNWHPAPEEQRATDYLNKVASRFRGPGRVVHTEVARERSAADAILAAGTVPGSLIALATHGRGGLTRLLLGSVADKVIRAAVCPVLVCRPSS